MTATNHALSGAVIGLSITQPAVALPLAFASHFVLDALPHFGLDEFGGHHKARKKFHQILYVDALLLTMVFALLLILNAPWLAFACAVIAGSPDLIWAYRYIVKEKTGRLPESPKNWFNQFHSDIQKSQTIKKGLLVEVSLAAVLLVIFFSKL